MPRVVLCAALTVDGKLDARAIHPARQPWPDDPTTTVLAEAATAGDEGWDTVLRRMRRESGVRRVVCPGGAERFRSLLDAGVVSELWLEVHPRIDGRRDAATLSGPPGADFFPASVACRLLQVEMSDGQCLLRYQVRKARVAKGHTEIAPGEHG